MQRFAAVFSLSIATYATNNPGPELSVSVQPRKFETTPESMFVMGCSENVICNSIICCRRQADRLNVFSSMLSELSHHSLQYSLMDLLDHPH